MGRKKTNEELLKEFQFLIIDINYNGYNEHCSVVFTDGTTRDWNSGRKAMEWLNRNCNFSEERAREKVSIDRPEERTIFNLDDLFNKYGNTIKLKDFALDNKLSFISASSILDTFKHKGLLNIEYKLNNGVYAVIYTKI